MDWCAASHACGGVQHDQQPCSGHALISEAVRGRTNERAQSHRITSTSSIGQHPRPTRRRDHVASLLLRVWRRTGQPHSAVRGSILLDSGVSVALRLAVWPPARSYWRALCQPSPVLSSQPARRPQRLSDRMGAKGDRGRAVPGRSAHAWPARPSASSYLQPWQSSRAYFALSCFACARAGRRRRDGDAAVAAAAAAIVVGRALAASAPASLAASACTRADSCRQHMCVRACVPLLLRPLVRPSPIAHPSITRRLAWQRAREDRSAIVALPPRRHRCSLRTRKACLHQLECAVRSEVAEFRLPRSLRRLV